MRFNLLKMVKENSPLFILYKYKLRRARGTICDYIVDGKMKEHFRAAAQI